MTSLQTRRTSAPDSLLPAPTTHFSAPWLADLRRSLRTDDRGKPTLPASLRPDQRRTILALGSILGRMLSADTEDLPLIGVEIAKLLAAFPVQATGSDVSADLRVDAYAEAIGAAPAWAVQRARLRVVRGEVEGLDPRWCPTPPQFALLVRAELETPKRELADLRAIAMAQPADEPVPPEVRERRAAELQALAEKFRADQRARDGERRARRDETLERANARAFAAECAAHGVDPAGGVSPALLASLHRLEDAS